VKAKWQVVARWADACLRAGAPERAIELLSTCRFKPWEGEARPRLLWKEAHIALGHRDKEAGKLAEAREHFEAAAEYPHHLAVGKPVLTDDADALFWAGSCALGMGDKEAARRFLASAATEPQPREATTSDFKSRAADLLRAIG
jgi:tetratricopeptide (TPR) repeat protein